jgi:hypothetical protein
MALNMAVRPLGGIVGESSRIKELVLSLCQMICRLNTN